MKLYVKPLVKKIIPAALQGIIMRFSSNKTVQRIFLYLVYLFALLAILDSISRNWF